MVSFSADSKIPKGFVQVEKGKLTAKRPKKERKGAAHCMRVDQQGSTKDAQFKLVCARRRPCWLITLAPCAIEETRCSSVASCAPDRVSSAPDRAVVNGMLQVLGAENDDELQRWIAVLSRFEQGI